MLQFPSPARRHRGLPLLAAAGALLFGIASASAQTQEIEAERARRDAQMEKTLRETAAAAKERQRVLPSGPVTFEQVLAEPDNLLLNIRFANAMLAEGNLDQAAATLERILMLDPTRAEARVLYGVVLFRLGNLADAERELSQAAAQPIPDDLKRRADEILADIRHSKRRTRWAFTTTAGYGYDSNRNAAPTSKQRLFTDAPLGLTGTSRKRRDTSALFVETLSLSHAFDAASRHRLLGSLSYFHGEQTSADDLDLQSGGGSVGWQSRFGRLTLRSMGFSNHVLLSRETFLRSHGLDLHADLALTKRWGVYADASWANEAFSGITENATATNRSGDRYSLLGGMSYLLSPTMKLDGEIEFEDKDAKEAYNAYDGYAATARHTWLLGHGQFLVNALTFGQDVYIQPDAAISRRTRRDKDLRYRFSYGAPLEFLLGLHGIPDVFKQDWTATANFEQQRAISTLTNYTYRNSKMSVLVTRSFDF